MSIADGKKFTVAQIKATVEANGSFFFTRDTMKFFGDTMKSFATILDDDGVTVMYRKPDAMITNMRGERVRAGRNCFNCWTFIDGDLHSMDGAEKDRIYAKI